MSDFADQSFHPTKAIAAKRSTSPIVWLVVLLVAAGAFAATIAYSGGVSEALKLVGLSSLAGGFSQGTPTEPGDRPGGFAPASGATSDTASSSTSAAPSATATKTPAASATKPAAAPAPAATAAPTGSLSSSARSAMYREQLQSQATIGDLVNNELSSLRLGTPNVLASSATVPVTATYRSGSSVSGTMTLRKYNGLWYFYSLTGSGGGSAARPGAIDSSVVSVITRQQATAANQQMITKGILGGGFKTATITGVSKGSGTATVNFNMTGGSARPQKGQFVCISKRDGASTYWFVARFTSK